jgi:perosamine synthetase
MLRHLPPTAAPITPADVRHGMSPPATARAQFEAALTQYLGVHTCKLAASGRTALYLLLKALRQGAGHSDRQEVVMPAYTCPALAKVAIDAGLRPRFVDISPDSLAYQTDHLEASIGERTLVVICVHPFGIPQAIEHVQALAHGAGAVLIEDAAQSMGARLDRKRVGTLGDFGLFSLGPGKPLSTGGGGVVCTRDRRHAPLLERAWEDLRLPSVASSAWALVRFVLCNLVFHPSGWWLGTRAGLHHVGEHEASWGYTVIGLNDSQAAVGLALLTRLETVNRQRRDNARRLVDRLEGLEFVHIPAPAEGAEATYLRLPLIIDDEERRERLFHRLWEAGIGVGRMYRHALAHYYPEASGGETFPGADHVAAHLLTLPTHHYLNDSDVERITEIVRAERSRI